MSMRTSLRFNGVGASKVIINNRVCFYISQVSWQTHLLVTSGHLQWLVF